MELIATLIVFALVFFLLMSWGCGGRMVRGLRESGASGERAGVDRDPVCGMTVAPGEGLSKEHGARTLRFCSRSCLERFEEHPEMFGSTESAIAPERKET